MSGGKQFETGSEREEEQRPGEQQAERRDEMIAGELGEEENLMSNGDSR